MKAIEDLIASWQAARALVAEIERAEHPDITDHLGRVWTWKSGDLYRHCTIAAPVDMINDFDLPTQRGLDNPNSEWCVICIGGRTCNVPDCKPEWNCSHAMHQ